MPTEIRAGSMRDVVCWFLLKRELAAWTGSGHSLLLWWRDDDGRGPSERLNRLIALAEQQQVPLTLAIIPDGKSAALAEQLAQSPSVAVIQHGVDHINRTAVIGGPKSELLPEWDKFEIARRVDLGWRAIRQIPNAVPVFAPPWNANHPALEEALRLAGFVGFSGRDEWPIKGQFLPSANVHIDLMRWKDGARFLGAPRFLRRFTRICRKQRHARAWSKPIGVLTHHLDHDSASWSFLEKFLIAMKADPAVKWCAMRDLISDGRLERAKTRALATRYRRQSAPVDRAAAGAGVASGSPEGSVDALP